MASDTAMTGSLIVRAGGRLLALPLARVIEVFRMAHMAAELPRAPRHCLGVVDCRGRLVPVLDLAARLGLGPPRDARALIDGHVAVLEDSSGPIGWAVDEVRELNEHPLEALPGGGTAALGRIAAFALRVGDGVVPVLDPALLLTALARHELASGLRALDRAGTP